MSDRANRIADYVRNYDVHGLAVVLVEFEDAIERKAARLAQCAKLENERVWIRGFANAITVMLASGHDLASAGDALASANLTVAELRKARVFPSEIKTLKPIFKRLQKK